MHKWLVHSAFISVSAIICSSPLPIVCTVVLYGLVEIERFDLSALFSCAVGSGGSRTLLLGGISSRWGVSKSTCKRAPPRRGLGACPPVTFGF